MIRLPLGQAWSWQLCVLLSTWHLVFSLSLSVLSLQWERESARQRRCLRERAENPLSSREQERVPCVSPSLSFFLTHPDGLVPVGFAIHCLQSSRSFQLANGEEVRWLAQRWKVKKRLHNSSLSDIYSQKPRNAAKVWLKTTGQTPSFEN